MLKRIFLPMLLIGSIFSINAMDMQELDEIAAALLREELDSSISRSRRADALRLRIQESGLKKEDVCSVGCNPELNLISACSSRGSSVNAMDNGEKEGVYHVACNPELNLISACLSRCSSEGRSRVVTTMVTKYLDTGHFETDESEFIHIGDHHWERDAVANPLIVAKLKEKIAEFEARM